jgi:hypothetical protein
MYIRAEPPPEAEIFQKEPVRNRKKKQLALSLARSHDCCNRACPSLTARGAYGSYEMPSAGLLFGLFGVTGCWFSRLGRRSRVRSFRFCFSLLGRLLCFSPVGLRFLLFGLHGFRTNELSQIPANVIEAIDAAEFGLEILNVKFQAARSR